MKSFFTTACFLLCFISGAFGQGETDNWYFGTFAGLSFTSGSPVGLTTSSIYTTEGCASISDTGGNLLFYTDGVTVYNNTHAAMPNGNGLMGDISSTQSAIIIRKPGSSNIYYIFTVAADGGPDGFRYSEVDMTLQGGLGDVTATKNVLLQTHVTEKLCAVNAANDSDVWVMVHGFGDNAFYAYQVTAAGVATGPITSYTGSIHDSTLIQNSYGYMKFSPEGDRVAVAMGYLDKAEILDFNNLDGVVSNPLTIQVNDHCYGVEFSPNSARLYLTHYQNLTQTFYLDQFDLLAGSPSAILASQTLVYMLSDPDEMRALQLASDGKIYVARSGLPWLDVINDPDSLGALCFYAPMGAMLAGNTCFAGLPNFNASFFREIQRPVGAIAALDSSLCANSCAYFMDKSLYHPSSWNWSFPGASPSSSAQKNPGPICYASPGIYDVTLVVTNSMGSDTTSFISFITVLPQPATPTMTVSGDTITSSAAFAYQWYFTNSSISGATDQSYIATQSGNYFVMVTDTNGCSQAANPVSVVVSDVSVLETAGLSIYPNPAGAYCLIQTKHTAVASLSLTDATGRRMKISSTAERDGLKLFLGDVPAGLYYLSVQDLKGKRYTTKLTISK